MILSVSAAKRHQATFLKANDDPAGQSFGEEDLKYMLRQFGDENSVDFIKFAKSMHSKMANPAYNEAFADAFDLFDTGKKGELTKTELIAGMDKLGEKLTEEEAEEMLKVAAKRDDFVKIMSQGAGIGAPAAGAAAGVAPAAAAGGPARGPAGGPRPGASPRPAGGGPRPGASPRPAGGGPRPARG